MAINYGAKGAIVVQLQELLNGYKVAISGGQWAYPNLATDGKYGAKTADAVRNWRIQHGMSASGNVVDDAMWRALTAGGGSASGSIGGSLQVGAPLPVNMANLPYAAGVAAAGVLFPSAAGAAFTILDSKGRRYNVPANATVMIQDSSGVKTVAASAAQSALSAGGGSVLGVAANGADITNAAERAANGGKPPDGPFDWKKYEKYFLYGGLLLVVLFVTKE